MRLSIRLASSFVALAVVLACGGAEVAPEAPPDVVEVPVPRMPAPPTVRSEALGEPPEADITRRLSAAEPLMERCLMRRRPEIPGAKEAVAMSVDLHLVRVRGEGLQVTVERSGFDAPDVVDRCLAKKLVQLDTEGLGSFDIRWKVVADFP